MSEEKLYLRSSIRIDEIAQILCTNRTYVSLAIKSIYNCNFSDYINLERIKYAKDYMKNNKEITLDVVAYNSSFISASSFYKAFKKHTGSTPKIWLNEINCESDI